MDGYIVPQPLISRFISPRHNPCEMEQGPATLLPSCLPTRLSMASFLQYPLPLPLSLLPNISATGTFNPPFFLPNTELPSPSPSSTASSTSSSSSSPPCPTPALFCLIFSRSRSSDAVYSILLRISSEPGASGCWCGYGEEGEGEKVGLSVEGARAARGL